jgi:hypothetical protein
MSEAPTLDKRLNTEFLDLSETFGLPNGSE